MALLDDVIAEVRDERLRNRIRQQVDALRRRTQFGISFERHSPETLLLGDTRIRPGMRVALRGSTTDETYVVKRIAGGSAECIPDKGGTAVKFALRELAAVKREGEPVFPTLELIHRVERAAGHPDHILIEGENHSALQLLRWLYRGRVDCIYIDPPYNTGASDWKYNNNYVDKDDAFRSSKWLSMMERRLLLAKDLLAPDGVLVLAIDDYEFAHLTMLLRTSRLFKGYSLAPVVVQHNPRGTPSIISRTHEYAVFLVPPQRELTPLDEGQDETRDFRRRGRGENNLRSGRWRSFFAIHVDPETRRVVGIGPELRADEPYETGPTEEGHLRVYPLGRNGLERAWRNSRETTVEKIERGQLRCTDRGTIVELIEGGRKKVPIRSIWTGTRFNAGERGTNLVKALTGVDFPYPKSIYTVFDCLKAVVGERPNALVLDFFAGSGTTLNALCLMNEIDKGARQCILVTNNEVGLANEAVLRNRGLLPGDDDWEREGICRAITWPRCKNSVLGVDPNGEPLTSKLQYETGVTELIELQPEVKPLPFLSQESAADKRSRAALAAFCGLPTGALENAGWFVPGMNDDGAPEGRTALLFDLSQKDAFLDALGAQDHVQEIYFASSGAKSERSLSAELKDAVGVVSVSRDIARPMSAGFEANVSYLRLGFLDPLDVERGAKLNELLPALWAMSGAQASLPTIRTEPWIMPKGGKWALLIKSGQFNGFVRALRSRPEIEWAFLVTASDDEFAEMSVLLPAQIPMRQRIHLYRRYIDNFLINGQH